LSPPSYELLPFDGLDLRRLHALVHLRDLVFVVGQRITSVCEVDGEDPAAAHLLCWGELPEDAPAPGADPAASRAALARPGGAGGHLLGCARLFLHERPVRVGRIAVHPALQRRGLGSALMAEVHRRIGGRRAIMHAQLHLEGFYGALGWRRVGEPFDEAQIPHLTMVREPGPAALAGEAPMQQLVDGVYTWAWMSPEKGYDFNGWYVDLGEGAVVVDPPPCASEVLDQMAALGAPARVILTNKDHTRRSREVARRFGIPIAIHEADAPLVDFTPDVTFRDGEAVGGGLRAVHVPDAKSPGECALFHAGRRLLIVGDAVIGRPPGGLSMLPDSKFADPQAARRGLARLAALDFDALLVGDGTSLPTGGRSALRALVGR
jgi:predicted GNAT family N-acyltransferase/glyoxylase-like metal-dependent hydrolase (beta-lactamase superfamily II)